MSEHDPTRRGPEVHTFQETVTLFHEGVSTLVEALEEYPDTREAKLFAANDAHKEISRTEMEALQKGPFLDTELRYGFLQRLSALMAPHENDAARGFNRYAEAEAKQIGAVYARARQLKAALGS